MKRTPKAEKAQFRDRRRDAMAAYEHILRGETMTHKVADVVLRVLLDTLDGQDARKYLGINALKPQTTRPLLIFMATQYWVCRGAQPTKTDKELRAIVAEKWGTTSGYVSKIAIKYRPFADANIKGMSHRLILQLIRENAAKYRELLPKLA